MKGSRFALACLLVVPIVLWTLSGVPAAAQTCDRTGCGFASCATPAQPVPSDRWGGLKPLDTSIPSCTGNRLAFCRDSTSYNGLTQQYSAFPWFMSLDAENGYLFVALADALQVWDARTFPPQLKSELGLGTFPFWAGHPETWRTLPDVDAPEGVDDELAVVGSGDKGLVLIGLTNKANPKILYSDPAGRGPVHTATIGGRRYAFLWSRGISVFDMTQAKLYDHCVEAMPTPCPGVFLGTIGISGSFIDGVDQFIATNSATNGGVEIWDVSDPTQPQIKLPNLIGLQAVKAAALWKQGSAYYLALRNATSLYIYDVSCIASACYSIGDPLFSGEFEGGGTTELLDFSRSDGVPFLYLGSDESCSGGTQTEWLLDVSDPANPVDISPFNYWGWYYRGGPTGFNFVTPRSGKFVGRVFFRAAVSIFDFHQRTGFPAGGGSAIEIDGPDQGEAAETLTFSAHGIRCSPGSSDWLWSVGDGKIVSANVGGQTISVTWPGEGYKPVSARHSACGSAVGLRTVGISGPNFLKASFTFLPTAARVGELVTFDASGSSGGPQHYAWNFGDGAVGDAYEPVTHYRYSRPGAYTVHLSVSRSGSGTGCVSGTCSASTERVLAVIPDSPPLPNAAFDTSASCVSQFGFDLCRAEAENPVTFTAEAKGAASYSWDFGDGSTAGGSSATYAWNKPGDYVVSLTASNGQTTDTRIKRFQISPARRTVLIPWVAQTRGALVQSNDLYVHNPGDSPMTVSFELRKRGLPETNPPRQTRTIAPGATLFFADLLQELFQRENLTGFVTVASGPGVPTPVVTSFNVTFQGSSRFGQTVPGVKLGGAVPAVQQLVGLNDNAERLAYFGVTNPNPSATQYRLRFFDAAGHEIGHSADLTVSAFGQRQFQAAEIRGSFGVSGSDYRVQVETLAGGPLYAYGSNLRLATDDPSFIEPAAAQSARSYLVGTLSTPGLFGSLWRTDAVLANPGDQTLHAQLSFTGVGAGAQPTSPVALTLQPGETRRLKDVINGQLGIHDAVGVLTLASLEPLGVALPVFQGESYDDANPARRFGQSMAARGDTDVAAPGQAQILAGLRQDAAYRTVLWLFNPSDEAGVYDLVYRALDGSVLGRLDGVALGPGKARQLGPGQHPIPAAGVKDGFTVQILVRSGKLLAAAQVVNNATNDPAYVRGETQ